MKGMVTKNKDFVSCTITSSASISYSNFLIYLCSLQIPEEFYSILTRSKEDFVRELFPRKELEPVTTPRKCKPEGRKTILMRFKSSVNELVAELGEHENRDVHFIKCIRPNTDLIPETVQRDVVQKQLYACGIVDIVRIAGNGYPIRYAALSICLAQTLLLSTIIILYVIFTGSQLQNSNKHFLY